MLEKSISALGLDWVAPIKPVRKNRSVEEKRKIVLESLSSEASIAAVARSHNINANLLHTWRWQYRRGELGAKSANPSFVPVQITAKRADNSAPTPEAHLEIIVGEARVLVHGTVPVETLRAVLRALQT